VAGCGEPGLWADLLLLLVNRGNVNEWNASDEQRESSDEQRDDEQREGSGEQRERE